VTITPHPPPVQRSKNSVGLLCLRAFVAFKKGVKPTYIKQKYALMKKSNKSFEVKKK
jgi:hypothetical protein